MATLRINLAHRHACMRAHTATHLLHALLAEIFPQTKQAGSFVGTDELRFDFFAQRSLTAEELSAITTKINTVIASNQRVSVTEMPYQEAISTGAKAFFEDTYPEIVRVVSVESTSDFPPSVELCGGTHVAETGAIGAFVIVEQTAVAAGIKRIAAVTGPKVVAYTQQLETQLTSIADKVAVPPKQVEQKIEKILNQLNESQILIEKLAQRVIRQLPLTPGSLHDQSIETMIDYDQDIADSGLSFAEVIQQLKGLSQVGSRYIHTQSGQYALFHPNAKQIVQALGRKGGGSETFVQGKL